MDRGSQLKKKKGRFLNKKFRPGLGTWIAWIVDRSSESKIKIKIRIYRDIFWPEMWIAWIADHSWKKRKADFWIKSSGQCLEHGSHGSWIAVQKVESKQRWKTIQISFDMECGSLGSRIAVQQKIRENVWIHGLEQLTFDFGDLNCICADYLCSSCSCWIILLTLNGSQIGYNFLERAPFFGAFMEANFALDTKY